MDSTSKLNGYTESSIPNKTTEISRTDKPSEINALSFDQVNDNADELIELRGGGRYFGVVDPESGETVNAKQSLGPLCANCHKRGHIRSKCKTVVCHKCGVIGDHYETQCPTTMICAKCGGKGHKALDCTNKAKKRQYCNTCDLFNHNNDTCPNIWRSYLLLPADSLSSDEQLPIIYCYNCGDDKHFGDECKEPRTSRVPNVSGSAFSGNNLPLALRKYYFDRIQDLRLPKKPQFKSSVPKGPGSYQSNYNNNQNRNNFNNYSSNYNNYSNNYNNYSHNNSNNNYSNNYNSNYRPYQNRDNYKPNSNNSNNDFKRNKPNPSRSGYIGPKNKSIPNKPSSNKPSSSKPNSNKPNSNKKGKSMAPTRTGYLDNKKKSLNDLY